MEENPFDISQVKVAINTLLFTYLHDQVTLKELEELACDILYKMEELHEKTAQRVARETSAPSTTPEPKADPVQAAILAHHGGNLNMDILDILALIRKVLPDPSHGSWSIEESRSAAQNAALYAERVKGADAMKKLLDSPTTPDPFNAFRSGRFA